VKRTGTDHLLRAVSREQADQLERETQAADVAYFLERPHPVVWRLR
jgi:hypothetical protein